MDMPGMIRCGVAGDGFLSRSARKRYAPLFEAANRGNAIFLSIRQAADAPTRQKTMRTDNARDRIRHARHCNRGLSLEPCSPSA